MIRQLAGSGVTILLTTQYMDEADQLAARIAVIDHGKKIAEGTPRELKVATGSGFLHVAVARSGAARRSRASCSRRISAAAFSAASRARTLAVVAKTPQDANAALGALIDAGIELADFSMGSPSLDEVFFALTGKEQAMNGLTAGCASAGAVGALQCAGVRLARGAQVQARAGAALRSRDDAHHVHAAVHVRVRRRAGRLAAATIYRSSCPASWCRP